MNALQSESSWLQKALFAIHRAEDAHAEHSGNGEGGSYEIVFEDEGLSLQKFEEALENRIEHLMSDVEERRRALK